jgi:hypothetical protein
VRFLIDHSLGGGPLKQLITQFCSAARFPDMTIFTVRDVQGLGHSSDDELWFKWCGRQQPKVCLLSRDFRSYLTKELVLDALRTSGIHLFILGRSWSHAPRHQVAGRLLVLWDQIWQHSQDETTHLHELLYSKLTVSRVCETGRLVKGQNLDHL